MKIRRPRPEELDRAAGLLERAGCAPLLPGTPAANVLVALDAEQVVGVVALQVHGLRGLVGPIATDPSQPESVRSSLVRTLLSRAHEISLRDLFVVAENGGETLQSLGFAPASADDLPPSIRRSLGDAASKRLLRLELVSRSY